MNTITINIHNEDIEKKKRNIQNLFMILNDFGYTWNSGNTIKTPEMKKVQNTNKSLQLYNDTLYKAKSIEVYINDKKIKMNTYSRNYNFDMNNNNNIKKIIEVIK